MFNHRGELLLLRCHDKTPVDPRHPTVLRYWVTPGGGRQEGETFEEALLRELAEETGLTSVVVGPCVWTRELAVVLPGLGLTMCHERCFLCSAPRNSELDVTKTQMTETEREVIKELRWWSLDELSSSSETFRPECLIDLVRTVSSDGAPPHPIRLYT